MIRVPGRIEIRLNSRDPKALADFYVRALGFRPGESAGDVVTLILGASRVTLAAVPPGGRDYPGDVPGWSPLFQHFAMTTPDIVMAIGRLGALTGWRPISRGGAQKLPLTSGGVTAFKFRDPEGHPLEFIEFPGGADGGPPRVDHSAISVTDTAASVAFYERLGLKVGGKTLNQGPEQDALDGLTAARVEVTQLFLPDSSGPHIELLCYLGVRRRELDPAGLGDVAATRLVFDGPAERPILRDPDGHLLEFRQG